MVKNTYLCGRKTMFNLKPQKKMKLAGIFGTGTGKIGSSVFIVRKGQQIVRTHQPVVLNPKSAAQIAQRAKMKLASQMSAIFADQIRPWGQVAINGKSARNMFVKALFDDGAMGFSEDKASCAIEKLRLTGSSIDGLVVVGSSFSVTGLSLSFTARPLDDFVEDSSFHTVVVHNGDKGPEILGYSDTPVSSELNTTITVNCTRAPVTGDWVFVYVVKVNRKALPTAYRNIYSSGGVTALLDVVEGESISALRYSTTYVRQMALSSGSKVGGLKK